MKGYIYILQCCNSAYYVGSTNNLLLRIREHMEGRGSKYVMKRIPFTLVYYEEFNRIDEAFWREEQIKRWTRKKKQALIENRTCDLPFLSECQNITHHAFREWRENNK